jgi:His-Xaa-Ser system radical SAM maturase HxsB
MKLPEVNNKNLMPFRWRKLDGKILLTNDAGNYVWLENEVFGDFVANSLSPDHPDHLRLQRHNMIKTSQAENQMMTKIRRRNTHLMKGPSLHIIILTLRCNQSCLYCHANRKPISSSGFDMSTETATKVLDVIFESPSMDLTIEFQGGEPTLNFNVLRFIVEQAHKRNQDQHKNLYFSLVSNLSTLDQAQIDFLVDSGVMVCTSIDGPKELHDQNRRFQKDSAYQAVFDKIKLFDQAYTKRKFDPQLAYVNALATISKSALTAPEAIVDEYVRIGQKVVHLRPLNPFGMGQKIWSKEGYTADEFLDFYQKAIRHMIELNKQGVEIMEKMASLFLTRILLDDDPNYMDLRSPCGAGIGQLAYNYDGKVYTCDEGRMIGAMGDDLFCIGQVEKDNYAEIIRNPSVRALSVASCIDCLPGCADCAYAPYCGVCPAYNYIIEGDLVARSPSNERCKIQKGMLDFIFKLLLEPDAEKLLLRWTETKDRSSVYSGPVQDK